MPLTLIHARFATSVSLYFLAMMLWSFWRYFKQEDFSSNFRGALVISEIIVLLQGVLGLLLWMSNLRPERGAIHILYGIVAASGLPFIYSITKGRENRYEMLLYAVMYLGLVGIVMRSVATG